MKKKATYRSRKHFFQQLQDYHKTTYYSLPQNRIVHFLVEIIRTCNKQENWGCCASQWGYNSPMVNLVLTIRPRLTITTSLHHHGMSLNKQHTVSCYTFVMSHNLGMCVVLAAGLLLLLVASCFVHKFLCH